MEHHGDTFLSKSGVEAMMVTEGILNEKEAEDKDGSVRIQLMEAEVELQSEERDIMEANNEHKLKGAYGA